MTDMGEEVVSTSAEATALHEVRVTPQPNYTVFSRWCYLLPLFSFSSFFFVLFFLSFLSLSLLTSCFFLLRASAQVHHRASLGRAPDDERRACAVDPIGAFQSRRRCERG